MRIDKQYSFTQSEELRNNFFKMFLGQNKLLVIFPSKILKGKSNVTFNHNMI